VNSIGLVAAISAFLAIWFGHVAVRKIEFISPTIWLPAVIAFLAGAALEWISVWARMLPVSTALGILGITLLWDSLEFVRQQRRVRNGHAPVNPRNPRHAKFLAEPRSQATTGTFSKREPRQVERRTGEPPRGLTY
jgi:uncharacterized protein DUF4491